MGSFFKNNKYHAIKQEYAGSRYDSGKEARHAKTLDTMRHASNPAQRVVKWERQVKVPLNAEGGKNVGHYYCDFHVWFADGHEEWHEVKGIKTDLYRWKERHFLKQYPDRLFIVF